jgi:anti-anti-sigma factor
VNEAKSYQFERQPAYTRLALGAELNAFHWEDLQHSAQEILAELENGGHRAVIVDLTPLDYLGSAQLTLLVRVWKLLKGRDTRMIVELKAPVVREVLKTAGLLNVWEVADSRVAAFQMLGLSADGHRKISLALPLLGLIALAGAVGGVCLSIFRVNAFDPRAVLIAQLTCSAIALGAGLWTAIRGTGARRALGAGMVVASALSAVVSVYHHPRDSASPADGVGQLQHGKSGDSHDTGSGSAKPKSRSKNSKKI